MSANESAPTSKSALHVSEDPLEPPEPTPNRTRIVA